MVTTLLKGTPVADAATGVSLGRVHALYLDPTRREIAGLALRHGPILWRRRPGLIGMDQVRAVRPDAVLVTGHATYGAQGRNPESAGLLNLDALTRLPAVLDDGTVLGRIVAVRFGQDSHRLAGLEVEPDGLPLCRMVLDAAQVVRIGATAVVVRERAGALPRETTPPQPADRFEPWKQRVA